MAENMRIGPRVRRAVSAGFALGVVALGCTAVAARSATPIVTVGPTGSPSGGMAAGTVAPSGQTDVCLNQQHSGASPSTSSAPGVLQIADSSCTASSGSGTPTTAAAPSASGSDGAGGSGSGAVPAGGGARSSKVTTSTTVARRTAGSRNTSSTRASVSAAGARGLRITTLRSKIVRAKAGTRLLVLVTLRDGWRRLVRSAIVSIGRLPGAHSTLPRLHVGLSDRKGQAAFVVPVPKSMLGLRVLFRVRARTPSAHALRVGTVLVPRQRSHGKALRTIASGY
jgi:hypothetical protein